PAPPAPPPASAPATPVPPAPAPAPAARLALSVEVVDAEGTRVRSGELHLSPGMDLLLRLDEIRDRGALLRPQDLAASNPLVVADLPASLAGLTVTVQARVPGFPPGEEVKVTLADRGTTEVRLVVAAARSLEVQVSDAVGGGPVAGARVISVTELERREVEPSRLEGDRGPGWATTDGSGRALLTELGVGLHDIEVLADGYTPLTPRGVDPGPTPLLLRIERQRAGASLRVVVKGPDGAPVPGVRIELVQFVRDSELELATDALGVAEFAGLSAGHGIARVDLVQWFELTKARGWPKANVGELHDPFELAEGERKEIVLGFRGGTAAVLCTVVDAAGAPAPGVEVTFSGESFLHGTTDAKGAVEFKGVAAGRFSIALERKSDWLESADRALEDGERREVRLVMGSRRIRGRVLEAGPAGKPVAGATVAVSGERYASLRSDASGSFLVEEALPGPYEVQVVADGYALGEAAVVVDAEKDPAPVEVRLWRGGRIRFRLGKAPGGEFPEGALRVRDADGEEVEVIRDETGAFFRETRQQPPGAYTVEIAPPGAASRTLAVEIKDGEDSVIEVGE
ncbi:MAG TPA: carboxypeptidase regulatory-like domain-containing protein, partial [Planctomycetota bacterium]|nr:carboxypeptidase regulatory-like domain-containing protein [Planctomycetota bacterium]